jgi:hypothetical protein
MERGKAKWKHQRLESMKYMYGHQQNCDYAVQMYEVRYWFAKQGDKKTKQTQIDLFVRYQVWEKEEADILLHLL